MNTNSLKKCTKTISLSGNNLKKMFWVLSIGWMKMPALAKDQDIKKLLRKRD
jgi:hypothetical protein